MCASAIGHGRGRSYICLNKECPPIIPPRPTSYVTCALHHTGLALLQARERADPRDLHGEIREGKEQIEKEMKVGCTRRREQYGMGSTKK